MSASRSRGTRWPDQCATASGEAPARLPYGRLPRRELHRGRWWKRSPASRLAIVAVDAEGERRDWHFGELIARSAGLSGAFAARGVRRGDVVMTLVGNRIEWVLTLLACWRMGAVALPCNPQLRRHDLELRAAPRAPKLCVGEEALLAELPDGVADDDPGRGRRGRSTRTARRRRRRAVERDGRRGPALIVFTSGTAGEPRGVIHAYRYLTGQLAQAEHWLGSRPGTSSGARPPRAGRSRPVTSFSPRG